MKSRIFLNFLISITAGFFIARMFLNLTAYPALIDRFFLIFIPALSIFILSLHAFPAIFHRIRRFYFNPRGVLSAFYSLPSSLFLLITSYPYGLFAGGIIFLLELLIASQLNHPALNYNSNLFESDAGPWMTILASPESGAINRSVHPLSLLLIRPLFRLAATLFGGNTFFASIFIVSAVSGLIVFMAFIFIKRASNSTLHAFLFSIVLGLSASHLVFGSLTENYIFGAASLMLFILLIQSGEKRMAALVPVGILLLGITITNIAQGVIGLLISKFEFKRVIRFFVTTLSTGVLLTVFTSALHPNAQTLFFVPRDLAFEFLFVNREAGKLSNPVRLTDPRSIADKAILVARTMFLYSVIGPEPVVVISEKPPRPTIDIRTFDIRAGKLASYRGFANIPLAMWGLILLGSMFMYFKELRASKQAPLMSALAGVLGFNFLLHMFYGTELFLYSPYWTYALILFVALSLAHFAENRLMNFFLFSFLILIGVNNFQFIFRIFSELAPFYAATP